MIKIITSIDAYHEEYVSHFVDSLIFAGLKSVKIERVSKMTLGIFGKDVTHIYYESLGRYL